MGKTPALIFITRHGARLDAEDRQWQANSSAPYDSPLSYGGWNQAKALGTRIASILHARGPSPSHTGTSPKSPSSSSPFASPTSEKNSDRLHHPRVIIHSSPFLRCVQSSVAIGAGIGQYCTNVEKFDVSRTAPQPISSRSVGAPPPRAHTLDSHSFQTRSQDSTSSIDAIHSQDPRSLDSNLPASGFERVTLRVDACLGEWLSPDYYELITPPPPSNMMVAGAKAELLRSADPLQGAKFLNEDGSFTFVSNDAGPESFSLKELAGTLPGDLLQQNPCETTANSAVEEQSSDDQTASRSHRGRGYVSPTPTYALAPSESIPSGYFAHARDNCVVVDFRWDSMRDPQFWGNGGNFGEEWSAMHRRFRTTLSRMMTWYEEQDPGSDSGASDDALSDSEDSTNDSELVLILVTHGAGCNALIGALTNQPVLIDVGLASLTMASSRANWNNEAASSLAPVRSHSVTDRRRSTVTDSRLPEKYEIELLANSEHLRVGAKALGNPHSQPLGFQSMGSERFPSISESQSTQQASQNGLARVKNSSLGSVRRTAAKSITTGIQPAPAVLTSPISPSGLWGNDRANPSSRNSKKVTFYEGESTSSERTTKSISVGSDDGAQNCKKTESKVSSENQVPGVNGGLWHSAPPKDSKRRWTVGERR